MRTVVAGTGWRVARILDSRSNPALYVAVIDRVASR
jgi:hypothetical protein